MHKQDWVGDSMHVKFPQPFLLPLLAAHPFGAVGQLLSNSINIPHWVMQFGSSPALRVHKVPQQDGSFGSLLLQQSATHFQYAGVPIVRLAQLVL
jgi:hypothetical protein